MAWIWHLHLYKSNNNPCRAWVCRHIRCIIKSTKRTMLQKYTFYYTLGISNLNYLWQHGGLVCKSPPIAVVIAIIVAFVCAFLIVCLFVCLLFLCMGWEKRWEQLGITLFHAGRKKKIPNKMRLRFWVNTSNGVYVHVWPLDLSKLLYRLSHKTRNHWTEAIILRTKKTLDK